MDIKLDSEAVSLIIKLLTTKNLKDCSLKNRWTTTGEITGLIFYHHNGMKFDIIRCVGLGSSVYDIVVTDVINGMIFRASVNEFDSPNYFDIVHHLKRIYESASVVETMTAELIEFKSKLSGYLQN